MLADTDFDGFLRSVRSAGRGLNNIRKDEV